MRSASQGFLSAPPSHNNGDPGKPPKILRFPNTSQNFELKVPTVIVLDFKGKPPEHASLKISDRTLQKRGFWLTLFFFCRFFDLQTTSFDIPWFLGFKKKTFFFLPGKVNVVRKKMVKQKTSKVQPHWNYQRTILPGPETNKSLVKIPMGWKMIHFPWGVLTYSQGIQI